MGAFLDKPKIDKHNESGEGNGLRYGLASMQGWRVEMEDAHCAVTGLKGHMKDWSFFAVFDGHAGARASTYCASQLLDIIVDTEDFRKIDADYAPSLDEVKNGLKEGFLVLDTRLRDTNEVRNGEDKSGSTAVTILLSPTAFFFANCGDSRAMLLRDSKVEFATKDHKPGNPNERERIVNAGGSVIIQRVNGSLAVSRALGDFEYKNVVGKGPCEQLVSPEPEVTIVQRNSSEDQLIVLACDGVWDVMTNEELCAFLLNRMRISSNLTEICNQVIDTCLYKGSRDNMSIVVVALNNAPQPDADSIATEKQLDEAIERRIQEMFEAIQDITEIDLSRVLHRIGDEFASRLPPGGGLASKRVLIDEVHTRLHSEYSKKLARKDGSSPDIYRDADSGRRIPPLSMATNTYGADYERPFRGLMDNINYLAADGRFELDSDEHRTLNDEDDDALLLDREPVRDRAGAFNDDSSPASASDVSNGPVKSGSGSETANVCEILHDVSDTPAMDTKASADEPATVTDGAPTNNGEQPPVTSEKL